MEEKMNEIKSRTDLTNQEKFTEIQKLYQERNNQLCDQLNNTETDKLVDECEHYKNRCYIHCKVCQKYYKCFRCHDSQTAKHKIDRNNDIDKIKCIQCFEVQEPTNDCIKCYEEFAEYFCIKCALWTSCTETITHCDKCKICRIGTAEDIFHCDTCNYCIKKTTIDNHNCDKYYATDCPICFESLFDSQDVTSVLDCKHTLHYKCLNKYIKEKISEGLVPTCLICKKSVISVDIAEAYFDAISDQFIMNDDIKLWKNKIKCNDCEKESEVRYHYYNKCTLCTSYNTYVIGIVKE